MPQQTAFAQARRWSIVQPLLTSPVKQAVAVLAGLVLAMLNGCAGYRIGCQSLYRPNIHTVYVPVFQSDSLRRYLAERLTEAVIKKIEARTPYKVVATPDADSVLLGRIIAEGKHVIVENRQDEPRESEIYMQVQVRWIDRTGQPISNPEGVPVDDQPVVISARTRMLPEFGHSVATAQQEVIDQLADRIVALMELPW